MIDLRKSSAFQTVTRFIRLTVVRCLVLTSVIAGSSVFAADVTFNISLVGQSNPLPPASSTTWSYAEVWGEGNYAYVGSDRSGRGMSIFNISNPASPQFIRNPANLTGPITLATYSGSEMEDVEVYNGVGYFGSDVTSATSGTGVDIVNLSNPASPVMYSRVDSDDCNLSGTLCGHNKVHTLSVSEGFLYTVDNTSTDGAPDSVKIFNVSNPSSPQFVANVVLGVPNTSVAAHEVVVRNDRMYVASKRNSSDVSDGWWHIYDVSDPSAPVLLKKWESGARTHTVWPADDGSKIIVAEERLDGDLQIWDVSMIDQPNDPDTPELLTTLNDNNVGVDAYTPHHPFIRGNLLFLSWYEAGLQVFNIADPENPVHVGAFDTYLGGYNPTFGAEHGNWGVYPMLGLDKVLLGDRDRGLIIVDATGVLAPGDYDQNGIVNAADYTVWKSHVGSSYSAADGNKDGVVDAADYVVWRDHLGQTHPPGLGAGAIAGLPSSDSAVPEPAAILQLAIGVALGLSHRRTRRRSNLI